jgi:phage shock protein PspC (stress-responsive transcriptional regulator)
MPRLGELARLIRSKNAGPFELTIDVMFDEPATFERVRISGVLAAETIARLYGLDPAAVRFFVVPQALAFKASFARPRTQGDPLDADGHGGQQYAPLVELEVP